MKIDLEHLHYWMCAIRESKDPMRTLDAFWRGQLTSKEWLVDTLVYVIYPERNKELDFYFEEQEIKGRSSIGNQVTKYPIKSVKFKEAGKSTLSAKKIWFDDQFGRLNTEEKGEYLGKFDTDDCILVVYNDGNYEIASQELTQWRLMSLKI